VFDSQRILRLKYQPVDHLVSSRRIGWRLGEARQTGQAKLVLLATIDTGNQMARKKKTLSAPDTIRKNGRRSRPYKILEKIGGLCPLEKMIYINIFIYLFLSGCFVVLY